MSIRQTTPSFTLWRIRTPVSWLTIALVAIVIAYVDGFWVTSIQGTVGANERFQPPFGRWLRDSTLMLPLFFLAVLAAVALTLRLVGHRREIVKFATAALLIIVISSGVAIAEVAVSSAYDYSLQTRQIELRHSDHVQQVAAAPGTVAQSDPGTCVGLCAAAQHRNFVAHVRAVGYTSAVLLITNFVLVLWVLALRGGRLWRRPDRTPMSATSVVPEEWSVA